MPFTALLLLIFAAFAHASWNFLAKRASRHRHFIWFASVSEAALWLPLAGWIAVQSGAQIGLRPVGFLLLTGVLHIFYTESLLRGYRVGDFSLVYPVARGTGPLLSFMGAILLLGEHMSTLAAVGALLVAAGIFLLSSGGQFTREMGLPALGWGIATGLTIAGYTVVDGYSVKILLVSPILVDYAGNLLRTVVLSGRAWHGRDSLREELRCCWREAIGVGLLTPFAYVLVLFAMRIAPVSHVAPAREMSMLIAAYLGSRFLREGHYVRRLSGSALILAGVAALASR